MTQFINAAIVGFCLLFAGLGSYAYLAPREGHERSIISLIAGVTVAALMAISLVVWTKKPRAGRIMSLVLCVLCLGRFVPAWLSKGFYPNGVLAMTAALLLVLLAAGHMTAQRDASER